MIFSPPESVSEAYPPDAKRLFAVVRERTSLEALRLIAEADYGNSIRENLEALLRLARGGRFEGGLPWEPGEVLSLVRWSSPGKPGIQAEACLFACAALNCHGDPDSDSPSWGLDIIGPLTVCCLAAGEPVTRALIHRLVFDLEGMNSPEVAGQTGTSPWALALCLTAALAAVCEASLAREAGQWFRELHDKVWPLPQSEPFFMKDFVCNQPKHFQRIAAHARDSQSWTKSTRELLVFLAEPESSVRDARRRIRKGAKTVGVVLLAGLFVLWYKLGRNQD
jgi:hypothetical protein